MKKIICLKEICGFYSAFFKDVFKEHIYSTWCTQVGICKLRLNSSTQHLSNKSFHVSFSDLSSKFFFFLHTRPFVLIYLCQYKWNGLLYGTDNKSSLGSPPIHTHTYTFPLLCFTNFFFFFEVSSALAADCHFLPKILILLIFYFKNKKGKIYIVYSNDIWI